MSEASYLHGNSSKEAIKTTENLKKKGRKAVRVDSKTVIFVKQDADEAEAINTYRTRLEAFNESPNWPRR